MFEAPRKKQQAWLVPRFGADVNLANIPPADALASESLRLGLRADTFDAFVRAPHMTTLPDRYREVSVTDVDVPLERSRSAHCSPRVRSTAGPCTCWRAGDAPPWSRWTSSPRALFWGVQDARVLAGPAQTAWVRRPELDSGVPFDLALAAAMAA